MQNKKSKVFSEAEFEQAEGLDRLYMYLMQPDDFWLDQREGLRLEALRSTWAIMCSKPATWRRVKVIMGALHVSEGTARRYIQDASLLFGDILKTDADIEFRILRDKYLSLAERAELAGEFDVARRCYDSASSMMDKIEARTPVQKRVYAAVVFTNDPKALTSRVDAEDVEYEESDILELQAAPVPASNPAN